MKGIILSFSIESDRGAISGDDGNRYNFSSHNWKDTKEFPKRGLRVDFEIEEKTATEIYLALEEVRPHLTSPQKRTVSIGSIDLEQEQVLGLVGSLILFFGIFTPLIRLPLLGSLSLASGSNSLIIIALAIASLVFIIRQSYQWLWLTGIGSLFFTLLIFVSLSQKLAQAKAQLNDKLAGNVFGGLAAVAASSIQFEWGWIFLLAGSALLIAVAYLKRAERSKQVLIGLGILGLVSCLLVFVVPTSIATFNENKSINLARELEGKNGVGTINRAQQAQTPTEQISQYENILARDPDNIDALVNLAKLYLEQQQPDKAMPVLEKIVQQQPDKLDWQFILAQLYENKEEQQKAEAVYDRILAKQGNNVEALVKKAVLRSKQGDTQTAKTLFAQAEKAAPTDSMKGQVKAISQSVLQESN